LLFPVYPDLGPQGPLSDNMLSDNEGTVLGRNISLECRPRTVWQRVSQTLFFDYEDDDEKQSTRHFMHLPLESLLSSCPIRGHFSRAQSRIKLSP